MRCGWGAVGGNEQVLIYHSQAANDLQSGARYTATMNRRTAKRVFAVTGRLLLALSLLFATGPWAQVLAAARAADCAHRMSAMQHGADNGDDCCADMGGEHGVPACGKHGSLCGGVCAALCAVSCSGTLPAVLAFTGLPLAAATPLPRSGGHVPSLFASPALRPPISL